MYRIGLDTFESEPLLYNGQPLQARTNAIDVSRDKVYFTNESLDNGRFLYEAAIDGTSIWQRAQAEATTIKVFGDRVYLYHPSRGGQLKTIILQE